ncbi:hypothetical protein JW926_13485, partial [Candidatus Sumerlaeota bacterium]|nr:hypothetical protein [Candidatus Sumerlaeota bacterium]
MQIKTKKDLVKSVVIAVISMLLLMSLLAMAKDSLLLAQNKTNPSPYDKQRSAEIEKYLEDAKEYFESAEFTFAQIFYDKALRLDPNNPVIQEKIEECKQFRERQNTLSQSAPKGEKLEQYLKTKYDTALALYKQKKYPAAKKEFEEIWLIAPKEYKGNYKSTQKYIAKINENMSEEKKVAADVKTDDAKIKKQQIENLIDEGKKLQKEEKFDEAIAKYNQALALDRDNKDAQKLVKKAQDSKQKAIATSQERQKQQLADKQKTDEEANKQEIKKIVAFGEDLLKNDKYEEAIAKFNEALALDRDNKDAQKLLTKAQDK